MSNIEKAKPVFSKVSDLKPASKGHNLIVKVIESKPIPSGARGRSGAPMRMSECLVGDETAVVIFTARNEQVDMAQVGNYLTLRNARVDMFKGSMRLAVNQWGKVEVTKDNFNPKTDNNLSSVEYELVSVTKY